MPSTALTKAPCTSFRLIGLAVEPCYSATEPAGLPYQVMAVMSPDTEQQRKAHSSLQYDTTDQDCTLGQSTCRVLLWLSCSFGSGLMLLPVSHGRNNSNVLILLSHSAVPGKVLVEQQMPNSNVTL